MQPAGLAGRLFNSYVLAIGIALGVLAAAVQLFGLGARAGCPALSCAANPERASAWPKRAEHRVFIAADPDAAARMRGQRSLLLVCAAGSSTEAVIAALRERGYAHFRVLASAEPRRTQGCVDWRPFGYRPEGANPL
jgi:hypothetical protein